AAARKEAGVEQREEQRRAVLGIERPNAIDEIVLADPVVKAALDEVVRYQDLSQKRLRSLLARARGAERPRRREEEHARKLVSRLGRQVRRGEDEALVLAGERYASAIASADRCDIKLNRHVLARVGPLDAPPPGAPGYQEARVSETTWPV